MNTYVNDRMRKVCVANAYIIYVLNVSFVGEDLLNGWKEAWFLLLPKMDDNHVVT